MLHEAKHIEMLSIKEQIQTKFPFNTYFLVSLRQTEAMKKFGNDPEV